MPKSAKLLNATLYEIYDQIKTKSVTSAAKEFATTPITLKTYLGKINYFDPRTNEEKRLNYEDLGKMSYQDFSLIFKDKRDLKLEHLIDASPSANLQTTLATLHNFLFTGASENKAASNSGISVGNMHSFITKFVFLENDKWERLNTEKLIEMSVKEAQHHWGDNYTRPIAKVEFDPKHLPISHIIKVIRETKTPTLAANNLLVDLNALKELIAKWIFRDITNKDYKLNFNFIQQVNFDYLVTVFGDAFNTTHEDYFKDKAENIFLVSHNLQNTALLPRLEKPVSNNNNNNTTATPPYSPAFFVSSPEVNSNNQATSSQELIVHPIPEISNEKLEFFYSGDTKQAIQVVWQGDTSRYVPSILEQLDFQLKTNHLTPYLTGLGSKGTYFLAFNSKSDQQFRNDFPLERIFVALSDGIGLEELSQRVLHEILLESTSSVDNERPFKKRK